LAIVPSGPEISNEPQPRAENLAAPRAIERTTN
jgi:hypothetical protein